jgi:tRNA A-37 threonylcarbamoyl transferase component Bud32
MMLLQVLIGTLFAVSKAQWTWVGGSQTLNLPPSFQQLLVESPGNSPGGVDMGSVTNGTFIYVFGGDTSPPILSNYLWRFNIQTRMWSVISAPSSATANFGLRGVFSTTAHPAAKYGAVVFLDKPLNSLFVFGGTLSFTETENTMFELNFGSLMWRWIHGTNTTMDQGNFGVLGIESHSNIPPSRAYSAYFYDELTKTAHVYGGRDTGDRGRADHWVYSVTNNTWTWIHGVQQTDARGIYGETGVGTPQTRPGARISASFAYDEIRRIFYFYGGAGASEIDDRGYPTDLWQYEPDRNIWTFLGGNRDGVQRLNYGTRGVTQNGTFPRSRYGGSMVVDSFGQKVYLFSGKRDFFQNSWMNDLWVLDTKSFLWTWISGLNSYNPTGRYGTMGVASPLNNPPPRSWSMFVFLNETREILLYGGYRLEYLADLWLYSLVNSFEVETASERSTVGTTSTARTFITSRLRVAGSVTSSGTSSTLIITIVAVSVFMVGLMAVMIACVRSRHLKQLRDVKQIDQQITAFNTSSFSGGTGTNFPTITNNSTTENLTLVPTTLGLSLPAHLEVEEGDFKVGRLLASGGGGDVYYGEAVSENLMELSSLVVVKRPKIGSEWSMKLFEQEISVMFLLAHSQYVAKIVGFKLRPPVLLMKMYTDGSLMSFAIKYKLSRKWKLLFSLNVARGLSDIHKAQIAHCDLKPHNVLIDRDSRGKPFCVITDFGIAQILSEKLLVVKYSHVMNVRGLSIHYAAPEVFVRFRDSNEINGPEIIKRSDMFAFAMNLYFVLCQMEPWAV